MTKADRVANVLVCGALPLIVLEELGTVLNFSSKMMKDCREKVASHYYGVSDKQAIAARKSIRVTTRKCVAKTTQAEEEQFIQKRGDIIMWWH